MFFSLSLCTGGVDSNTGPKRSLYVAAAADVLIGLALLIIGIVASQSGFLPSNIQYAFIGAGVAYSFGMLCAVGALVKLVRDALNEAANKQKDETNPTL